MILILVHNKKNMEFQCSVLQQNFKQTDMKMEEHGKHGLQLSKN